MRVLVLWANDTSSNLGVRALAQGTTDLVSSALPDAEVTRVHYGPGPAPVRIGDWHRLVRERMSRSSELLAWLSDFDLAIDTRAGDSFADLYGLERLATQSLLAELTREAGTPLVLGPQTIGPFDSRRGKGLGRWSLRRATAVMARDSVSAEYARSIGRPVDALTTDVVFALARPPRGNEYDVLLNISGLLWAENTHVDSLRYRTTVLEVARGLLRAGRTVGLLAHVLDSPVADNDVPAVTEAAQLLDDPRVSVVVPDSLEDVRRITASARLVIGSRMHACLNALSTGTPAVPLAYSRKFEPLLNDLGWKHTVDLRDGDNPVPKVLALAESDLEAEVGGVVDTADALLDVARNTLRSLE